MALDLEKKKGIVAELSNVAHRALAAVVAQYRGLTVSEMLELRKMARDSRVVVKVCRNTLARRAFKKTPYACLDRKLVGPIVLFFSQEKPRDAARLIEEFVKERGEHLREHLKVQACALGGRLLPVDLGFLAGMPSHKEALSQLASVLLAPMAKFVRAFRAPVFQIVRTTIAIRNQEKTKSRENENSAQSLT
ncbi:50S ribosomal protein L10 [Coxiella endosymbiont of Amblyomma sculptum]|uniref:50S ribosomal protein L10 n=1 Tax=Coxiella endosymbiont of Amblyomma sculptum TaxID=2487929 RepID=UPI00132EAE04|nr:50S ribosomal protein L10 [Coxiella endosymbiont of Amblyomma sculptum]QHG92430.1 50S ribosomal protein L10 [Coxiella endosymbiont of Amblyomma sculptum]